jgi:hypothetical protein
MPDIPTEAQIALAKIFIRYGEGWIKNGESLQEMGDRIEGRCRELVGLIICEAGESILHSAQHGKFMQEIDAIKDRIADALREQGNTEAEIEASFNSAGARVQEKYEASKPKCSKCGQLFYWRKIQWCQSCDLPMEKCFGHDLRPENDGGFQEELSDD